MSFKKITNLKTLANIATVGSFILMLIIPFSKPNPRLIAEVKISEFTLPPAIKNSLDMQKSKIELEESFRRYMLDIRITNRGNLACEDASIKLDGIHQAVLQKESGEFLDYDLGENKVIEIGSINPGENIKIFAWTGPFLAANIKLTHKDGKGEVIIEKYPSLLWQYIINKWRYLVFLIILLIFVLTINKDLWCKPLINYLSRRGSSIR